MIFLIFLLFLCSTLPTFPNAATTNTASAPNTVPFTANAPTPTSHPYGYHGFGTAPNHGGFGQYASGSGFNAGGPSRPTRRGGKGKGKGGDHRHVNNLSGSVDGLRELVQSQAETIAKLLDRQDRHERFFDAALHDQWQFFCSKSLSVEQMTSEQKNLLFAEQLEQEKAKWLLQMKAHVGQGDGPKAGEKKKVSAEEVVDEEEGGDE